MNYKIRGNKIKITTSMEEYLKERIGKLDKYFHNPESIEINALVSAKNKMQTVEITIYTNHFTIRAEEKNNDFYVAIDLVLDKIERQIKKSKQKLIKINKDKVKEFMLSYDEKAKEKESKIVKRKKIETKPMSEEEAVLQMEMLGHDFFIYKDYNMGKTKVMYRRKDGDLGVIEVE